MLAPCFEKCLGSLNLEVIPVTDGTLKSEAVS